MRVFLLKQIGNATGGIRISSFCSIGRYIRSSDGDYKSIEYSRYTSWWSRDDQHVELKVKRSL